MTNYDYMSGYNSGILNLLDNFGGDIEAYIKQKMNITQPS